MVFNVFEYVLVFYGVVYVGGIVIIVNLMYIVGEVKYQFNDLGVKLLVMISFFVDVVKEVVEGMGVEEIFMFDLSDFSLFLNLLGVLFVDQVVVDLDDIVVLFYFLGIMGFFKGVMFMYCNFVVNFVQCEVVMKIDEGEMVFFFLLFFYIYGMQVLMNGVFCQGGKVVIMLCFDFEQFFMLVQDNKIKCGFVVLLVVFVFVKYLVVDQFDFLLLQLFFFGVVLFGGEFVEEVGKCFNCEVVQGYGMIELFFVSYMMFDGQYKVGMIGLFVLFIELCVVDLEFGVDFGVGEDGEIWVCGLQVMFGYLNNDQVIKEMIDDDGWLYMGDIGYIDEDGYFIIVDCFKEFIKYKGFQVLLVEFEVLFVMYFVVVDVVVIGIFDDEVGELFKGFIILKLGFDMLVEDIQFFVVLQVVIYKQLCFVEFVDEIFKLVFGKILCCMLCDQG